MVDGIDDKPLLWNRFTFGEFESLKIMLKQGWNEWQKDKSKLPTYKYTGSEDIKVGMGSTSIAQFDFIGCRPRKDTFVIPSWDTEPLISDGEVKMASEKQDFQKLVNNAENENGLTFDDIPF
jgi:hypothetical protein